MTSDGHIVADFVDTGKLTAGVIKAGVLSDLTGTFSLNMVDGTLVMNRGTFKGALSAATGTFAGSLSAATGSFSGQVTASSGQVGDFIISSGNLTVGDALLSRNRIGCGKAGNGIINLVGNNSSGRGLYGYIQISNSGDPTDCRDGIRIYGNGAVVRYDSSGNEMWTKDLQDIP